MTEVAGSAPGIAVPLRSADTDSYGHLHHAMFLTLIEHARMLWLRDLFEVDTPFWDFATVHLTIDYRAEVLIEHGEVVCTFEVAKVGNTSIGLRERMEAPAGRLVAELETVIVAWEPELHRTRALTEEERSTLLSLG